MLLALSAFLARTTVKVNRAIPAAAAPRFSSAIVRRGFGAGSLEHLAASKTMWH
jgi:hypothetical protein